jgi:GTPase
LKFVDFVQIHVHAGNGGDGSISFRREKYVPKGGPDGGNGGRGGSIIVRANRNLTTLLDFQYRRDYVAKDGADGAGARKSGHSGADITLGVPVGTIIRENNRTIADLTTAGAEVVVAKGGHGGRGNSEFATPTNQAPRIAEPGEPGEERELELELKLLADVGLVGLPNAGKSTLISTISAARPKIADYPFTTLVPNLGIVRVDEGRSLVVADIPGLIAGAHLGKGLGVQFLKHIERTRVLVFLLDAMHDDVRADYEVLATELRTFNPALMKKPRIVAFTKIDSIDEKQIKKLKALRVDRRLGMCISAVSGKGIPELVAAMWSAVHGRRT